jgi:predicted nucleotidyltransferase
MLNKTPTLEELKALSPKLSEKIPYLKMLVLFGSRARGDIHANSDWDFAALYDENLREESCKNKGFAWFEVPGIIGQVFSFNSDEIDVVELNRCTPLIGYQVARDGKLLYEQQPGDFINFQRQAWKIYADTAKFRKAQRQSIKLWLQKWGI